MTCQILKLVPELPDFEIETYIGISIENKNTNLDGVGIAIAVLSEVRRTECDARLNRFRLAREVAQVDLGLGEQILAAAARHVLDPLANSLEPFNLKNSFHQRPFNSMKPAQPFD